MLKARAWLRSLLPKFMDHGFKEIMDLEDHPDKKENYFRDIKEFLKEIKTFPEDQRVEKRMLQNVWGKSFAKLPKNKIPPPSIPFDELEKTKQCKWCWLQKNFCSCNLTIKTEHNLPFNLIVFMHYCEFRRASNTGKVISASLKDEDCQTFLYAFKGIIVHTLILLLYLY